jgi:uncharacterized protein YndB with AHSA1/START domain
MIRFEQDVTIHRPVDEVFSFLSEPANMPLWQDRVVRTSRLTAGSLRVGTEFEQTLKMPWGAVLMQGALTALDPDRIWGFEASSKTLTFQATFELAPVPEGTRLVKRGSCDIRGPLRLIEPMMGRDAPRMVKDELDRIRTHLESQRAAS